MSTNKTIAHNVIALFFRMVVTMAITLYSVRLLLDILGVENYGVYTVVAGFVTMLSFLSQSMSIAIQRFLSFEMGKGNFQELSRIFSISSFIFFFIAVSLLILSETLGLWFVKNKLIIPKETFNEAILLFHFSVFTFCISIFRIPYIAVLQANEDMRLFAILNIFESVLKLISVIILPFFSANYLYLYGLFLMIASIISLLSHIYFTVKKYKEAIFKFYFEIKLFKSILTFSGWSLFGLLAGVGNNQGNNLLINVFFGPSVNAAREVAVQVQNAIMALTNSIYIAFKPQLIKSYAENNYNYMMNLFYLSTKAIFFLNLLVCIPLFINFELILNLWLTKVTVEMVVFTKIALIFISIFALNNPITTLVQATGKIKKYALTVETTILLSLPLTYVLYTFGLPAETTFWVSIFVFTIAHFIRLFILKSLITFSIKEYFTRFLLPFLLILVLVVCSLFIYSLLLENYFIESTILNMIFKTSLALCVLFVFTYLIGLNNTEKTSLKALILNYLPFVK